MKAIPLIIAASALTCGAFIRGQEEENPKRHIEQLMRKSREAKEAGRFEEAQKLHAEAERIMAGLRGREGKMAAPQEAERLRHMLEAVGQLHAAGMHEQAEAIEQAARNLRRELEEQEKRRRAAEPSHKDGSAGEKRLHAELDEMRRQMRKMAEQIEQIQAELKKRGS